MLRIISAAAGSLLALALGLAPCDAVAGPQIGATELARARTLLDISRAQLTAEQFALLSRKLAAAESAYAELTTVARAGQAMAAATEGGGAAASAKATATGGRALLSGVAELLPLLLLVWPATAHAPGVRQETPEVRAAKSKVEESLKELAQAARQVDAEREAAAARAPRPALQRDAAEKGGSVTKEIIERGKPGADGATSKHIIEKMNGETISKTHQVTKDGKIIHQHQDHLGKHGGEKRFPDEWTGTETIDAPGRIPRVGP